MTSSNSFAHRLNSDSSVDSICTRCYQTVASDNHEPNLESAEASHECAPGAEFARISFRGKSAIS